MKRELYTEQGWVNTSLLIGSKAFITCAIGGRGIGKTYGCLLDLYKRGTRFLYLRRTQNQLDETTMQALNPYNEICKNCGYMIAVQKVSRHTVGFYNAEKNEDGTLKPVGDSFAVGAALNTFASIRGMSLDVDMILFDEIIPERHERKIKNEGEAFLNLLESVNRNRELTGKKPIHVILLSNSNSLQSEILDSIGALKSVSDMARKGIDHKTIKDGLIDLYMYKDSPISERKKNTALYKISNRQDFSNMALENDFSSVDYEQVKERPLQEYNILSSIGEITLCRHKSKREYYVIEGVKSSNYYPNTPISVSMFRRKYTDCLIAYMRGNMYFSNPTVKIYFERMFTR